MSISRPAVFSQLIIDIETRKRAEVVAVLFVFLFRNSKESTTYFAEYLMNFRGRFGFRHGDPFLMQSSHFVANGSFVSTCLPQAQINVRAGKGFAD